GDGSFGGSVSYVAGTGAKAIALADLDGDNKLDVVTGNTATVSVLRGNGNGTFQAHVDYPGEFAFSPNALAIADFDGDGKLDVVAGTSDEVALLRGNGDGTLQAKVPIGIGLTALTTADFNADGKPDLAGVGTGGGMVLLGNGDGSFQARTFVAGQNPQSVFAADLDHDGVTDLVVTTSSADTVSVLLGDGTGGFAAKPEVATGSRPMSAAVADIDGDGNADIVVTNRGSPISLLFGHGDGTFALSEG